MAVDVTFAGPPHAAWLGEEDRHVPPEWIRRCIEANEYFIASASGAPIGFLRFSWFWRTIPYMELIRVLDDHRRKGVGTALVTAWEASMRSLGARLLMTSSMSDEPEPQAWHRRNGFVDCGALTFGHLQPTPEVFLVKAL